MSQLWVQLGRNGDILNILPLLHDEAAKGRQPNLMLAEPYAGLLDGISYLENPVIFEGQPFQIREALEQAAAIDPDYICTQVNGPTDLVRDLVYRRAGQPCALTTSYQKEMWKMAGKLDLWGTQVSQPHAQLPLVFDRRNPERESKLIESLKIKGNKKLILVSANGNSSPFAFKPLLLELLKLTGYRVIDLGEVKAERLFDLIGLMELASALIATDSAPLHLAAAVPNLPILALVQDQPQFWSGSSWKAQHVWYCRYGDFPQRAVEMLEKLKGIKRLDFSENLVHLWNGLRGDPVMTLPYTRTISITQGLMGRLGPTKDDQHPFVKDVLKMGIQAAAPHGWVLLSRTGLDFCEGAVTKLMLDSPCYAYRLKVKDGHAEYWPYVEFLCAKATWWQQHLVQVPELYLNHDFYWSEALWTLFKTAGAKDLTGICTRTAAAAGDKPAPVNLSPSTTKNLAGHKRLFTDLKIASRYPKVSDQIDTVKLDNKQLFAGGYNPSILKVDDGFLLAYRFHPDETPATEIALARLDGEYKVISNDVLLRADGSADDPRLCRHPVDNTVYISWVDSTWPQMPPVAVIKSAKLDGLKLVEVATPNLGKNDYTSIEKNWVFWWQTLDGYTGLRILYQTSPTQVVYNDGFTRGIETPGPAWAFGQPRGGTPPVEFEGNLLRFFHSSTRTEITGVRHRYYLGAYVMEKTPPYKVLAVSKKPIVYGSELDNLKVKERPRHWLANVIFPAGVVTRPDGWIVSAGVNDSQCALLYVRPENLNL